VEKCGASRSISPNFGGMTETRFGPRIVMPMSEEQRREILLRTLPDYQRKGWSVGHNAGTEAALFKRALLGGEKRIVLTVNHSGVLRVIS
jgi:hypothetical protein